jgi:hypothetical protein
MRYKKLMVEKYFADESSSEEDEMPYHELKAGVTEAFEKDKKLCFNVSKPVNIQISAEGDA